MLGVLERKPEVRRIKIKTLSPDKNMAQLAADIVDKCKYIHPSRVEEIEQLLIKLRKHSMANPPKADDESSRASSTDRERDRDRDRDRERRSAGGVPPRQQSHGIASSGNGRRHMGEADSYGRDSPSVDDRSTGRSQAPPADNLPPAIMNDLDEYLDMLYQVSGKSEKEKEEGLKLQVLQCYLFTRLIADLTPLLRLSPLYVLLY